MTTNIDQLTANAQKAAQALQDAQDKLAAEELARRDTIDRAQLAWRNNILDHGKEWDDQLAKELRDTYEAAEAAIRAGDLNEAFRCYTAHKTAAAARYTVRTEVLNAAQPTGREPYTNAHYTDRTVTWEAFVTQAIDRAAGTNGTEHAETITGTIPTDYDEAEAYLAR